MAPGRPPSWQHFLLTEKTSFAIARHYTANIQYFTTKNLFGMRVASLSAKCVNPLTKGENMLTGFYSGVSGILNNEKRLDVIANNTANVDTSGFRRELFLMRTRENLDLPREVDSAVAARLQKDSGVDNGGIYTDYKPGKIYQTGNDFDVAIAPELRNAFFSVRRPGGDNEIYYSRNSTLSLGHLDPKNPASPQVLFLGDNILLDSAQQPISVDASMGPVSIGTDGKIKQNGAAVGEIPLYRLNKSPDTSNQVDANLAGLLQKGNSLLQIPPQYRKEFNPVRINVGDAGGDRLMVQGMREGSNVNVMEQLVDMMSTQKATEANATALKTQVDGLTKFFQMVRG